MALTCGFYNSVDGDRKYDATQFASLFDGVITDGIVAAVGDFFATTPGGGMTVDVGTGRAWFNRTWTYSDAKIPLTLDSSDLLYDRIDTIVLEIDTSIAVRDNSIKVIKGTPAQEPQKPSLTNAGDIHQYALAYIRVKASSIEIGAGDITINVGQADCPFVTSIVETPELEVLFAQWDAQFTEWFENVQAQLEGDVAANLQRQIDLKANKVDVGDFETPAKKLGLTGDLSVGASLGVLATAGDLHVWRRTVSSLDGKPEVPAGYTLGDVQNGKFQFSPTPIGNISRYEVADSLTVSNSGIISLVSPTISAVSSDATINNVKKDFLGKFVKSYSGTEDAYSDFASGNIFFIPESAIFTKTGGIFYTDSYQTVTGYPYQPAVPPSTVTVDYPVSVNPNAYQEGSDAQPAGYTLGEVQNGSFKFTTFSDNYIIAGDGVNVSQGGSVSLSNNTLYTTQRPYEGDDGAQTLQSHIVGKFFYLQDSESEEFNTKQIYYVPFDATVTWNSSSGGFTELSKYQTVTGYPAIPAGTAIEYLGKLGDKGITGSYVGTGTKGSSNPNKIRFNRRPDVVFVQPSGNGNAVASFMCIVVAGLTNSTGNWNAVSFAKGGGSSSTANGYEIYASYDDSTNELSWFCASTRDEQWQQNSSGITYNYVAK